MFEIRQFQYLIQPSNPNIVIFFTMVVHKWPHLVFRQNLFYQFSNTWFIQKMLEYCGAIYVTRYHFFIESANVSSFEYLLLNVNQF